MTNPIDFLAMLDIAPQAIKAPTQATKPVAPTSAPRTGLYAVAVDEWDIAQGDKLQTESRHFEAVHLETAVDCFALYFQQAPQVDNTCANATWTNAVQAVLDSPEYAGLHAQTRGNYHASFVAAEELARTVAENDLDRDNNKSVDTSEIDLPTMMAMAGAVAKAQSKLDDMDAIRLAFGGGCDNTTTDASTLSQDQLNDIYNKTFGDLGSNEQLRRILELAGRYRRVAQSMQRTKATHGTDEIVGVEQDNDVSRLLVSELSRLGDDDLELDFLRRFAESQTMCRQHQAKETEGAGPIVVCVDESSSMKGDRLAQAKAFALAMAWIARHQKRYCALVSFAARVDDVTGRATGTLCVLDPKRWDANALSTWLSGFLRGGTSPEFPLVEVPQHQWASIGAPVGKTDMLLITDGEMPINHQTSTQYNAWKVANKARLHAIVIGDNCYDGLATVSDTMCNVNEFNLQSSAVRNLLAL